MKEDKKFWLRAITVIGAIVGIAFAGDALFQKCFGPGSKNVKKIILNAAESKADSVMNPDTFFVNKNLQKQR